MFTVRVRIEVTEEGDTRNLTESSRTLTFPEGLDETVRSVKLLRAVGERVRIEVVDMIRCAGRSFRHYRKAGGK